jgi:signal peptidase I
MRLVAETSTLFQEILNRGLILRVKATGRSMAPFLTGGEILTIKKVPGTHLYPGDLLLYKTCDGFLILHRIVEKKLNGNTYSIRTKGDALISLDVPVIEDSILGKVCTIERNSTPGNTQYIDMESPYWRSINYLRALLSFSKWKALSSIGRTRLYQSFRSVINSVGFQ